MKKILFSLVTGLLLFATMPLHATSIVYGTFSGVVTSSTGEPAITVGMPVTGTFSYDYDLLGPANASGIRELSLYDPNASFYVETSSGYGAGYPYPGLGYYSPGSIDMSVDANGLPYSGSLLANIAYVQFDSDAVGVLLDNLGIGWTADVNYTITSGYPVPDAGATWFLLGIGLAGVVAFGRFLRRTPV